MHTDRIKCFAINVEKNDYRKQHILSQSDIAGLPIHIFKAITPATSHTVAHRYDINRTRRTIGRSLIPTELAAGLSHLQLWRDLVNDKDHDFYLIFEDDIHIRYNFLDLFRHLDPNETHFVKLSGQYERPTRLVKHLSGPYSLHRYAYGPFDAAAYLISKPAAHKMIRYCETFHAPVDVMMDSTHAHGVTFYGILPYPADTKDCFDISNPLLSDVGTRDYTYASDITWVEKICVKSKSWIDAVHRKHQSLRLRWMPKNKL